MKILLVQPSNGRPRADARLVFQLADGLATWGDEVHVVHIGEHRPLERDDLGWFAFHPSVAHHLTDDGWDRVRDYDICIGTIDESLGGLPLLLRTAIWFPDEWLEANVPKVSFARFLAHQGRELGLPTQQFLHLPPGIDHERYLITHGLEDRPRRIVMRWSSIMGSRPDIGVAALEQLRSMVPDVEVVVFGGEPRDPAIPEWMAYHEAPSELVVADQLYNASSIALNGESLEAIGIDSIEAMACGCALVTTANGAAGDFAIDDRTALVTRPGDVDGLTERMAALLLDDDRRIELATAGAEYVQRFNVASTVRRFRSLLERYRARPAFFRATRRRRHRAEVERASASGS